jgi:endonuclease/exonuclease/phosphatase family metal-dependent hydrolase
MAIIATGVMFYYWASSANHSQEEYSRLIENDYPTSDDGDTIITIITYNIGYLSGMTNNLPVPKPQALFDENLLSVYSEFEKSNADIICLQEIDYHSKRSFYVNQQEELQKLGYNNVFQAVNWDKKYLPFPYYPFSVHYGEMYSGQSVLSKYPLWDIDRIVLERVASYPFYRDAFYLDRLAQVSKILIGGDTVVLINVHLEAFDAVTRMNQTRYIADLLSDYKDTFPLLLAGDFNSDEQRYQASIKILLEIPGIKSAGHELGKTFPSVNPKVRLDYIFYNEKFIEMKSAKILTSFGDASDHLPLLMEFKLK